VDKPKGKVLLLGTEGCGSGDDNLSFEILMNLMETLAKREDAPAAIICWNTAVKLLAEGSPLLPHFRRLEEKGVHFLAGQLCVAELGLMDKMAIGKPATINEILDLMLHNDVISL
jgi:intracellular sulfur oxidation DsrE/DsrF family protein